MENKMRNEKFMTKGDILGMEQAIKYHFIKKNGIYVPAHRPILSLESFEELLARDEQREKDGFQKKIKIGKILVGSSKIIMVPYVKEEKLIHGEFEPKGDAEGEMAGHGEGEVGDVIAEQSPQGEGDGEGDDPRGGQGGGDHGIESEAYKLGKEISKKYKLPNLKDK